MTHRSTILLLLTIAAPALAQQRVSARQLSLEEAVRVAQERSEDVTIARAGVTRARGQFLQARSRYLPQLDAQVGYVKTLKSQFEAFASGSEGSGSPPSGLQSVCAPNIPENATPEQRAAALAQAATCQSGGGMGDIDFSRVGFGARNQWTGGLQLVVPLYTGGRVTAGYRAAQAGERAAGLALTQRRAQVALETTQAYYDASLAERMVSIADSTLEQTEDVLRQTTVARRVGNQSEFELLRAQVARDNQRPVAIQARAQRQVAYLRLKQLLDVPLDEEVVLTTPIEDAASPGAIPAVLTAARLVSQASSGAAATLDTSIAERAIVRQSSEAVRAQENLLRATRSQRFPTISLTSGYQRLFFPSDLFPAFSEYAENWTVGVSAGLSLFNGGRVRGETLVSGADLEEAKARLRQVQELAALDARVALNDLAQAEAVWSASQGTIEQAQRAYRIDEIRFREGIATQTDLAQTRILLQQASANRAVAARDLAVARIKLALLRDLPLQLGGSGAGGVSTPSALQFGAPAGAATPSPSAPQQPRNSQAASGQSASSSIVGGAP